MKILIEVLYYLITYDMLRQIILLRWWTAKENYKDYYDFVENFEINPYKEKFIKWSDTLAEDLWKEFEVIEIERFNKYFADYKAWKIIFEKYIPYIRYESIFIGHSLGGSFAIKYFEEDNSRLLEKFKKVILVAPAIKDTEKEVLWTFKSNYKFENLKRYQNKIIIFASKDDDIVPINQIEFIKNFLPDIDYRILEDRGHFTQMYFPELLEEIKK